MNLRSEAFVKIQKNFFLGGGGGLGLGGQGGCEWRGEAFVTRLCLNVFG